MKFCKCIKTLVLILSFSACNSYAAFINFNSYTNTGYGGQYSTGTATSSVDGSSLTLDGNLWVSIFFNSVITSTSKLYLDFEATGGQGELYGIGFDNDNVNNNFNQIILFGGTQNLSGSTSIDNYVSGEGSVSYEIDLGILFSGMSFNRIFFILDNDANESTSIASFSNVEICSDQINCLSTKSTEVSAYSPSGMFFMFSALVFFFIRNRAKL